MSQCNKIIEVKNLSIKLKNKGETDNALIINYGSFDIHLGDFVLIRGRNGSGKSTFLKLFKPNFLNYCNEINGELFYREEGYPSKSIFTYNTQEQAKLNRTIVDIEQLDALENWQSAYTSIYNTTARAINFDKSYSKSEKKEKLLQLKIKIKDYFEKYLQKDFKCNFLTFKIKRVTGWSGGQRKMISILAGMIKAELIGSKLILMDEPLNNLDGVYKNRVNELIKNIRKNDVAILVVTHCHIFEGINKELVIYPLNETTNQVKITDVCTKANVECLHQLDYYEHG